MKILISGATGLIGSALTTSLEDDGHRVLRLSRDEPRRRSDRYVQWDPDSGRFDIGELEKLQGIDAAIHLAGESLFGRWTPEKKESIRESRVQSTRLLSETLGRLPHPPRVLISASAVGYYGHRGGEVLREDSSSGRGFLASVVREWEDSTDAAQEAGIRVVHARFGVVLTKNGGALSRLLLPFKMGFGGPIGSGRQFMSWVSMDDVDGAVRFALENESLSGPINVTAPNPVPNRTFVKKLGQVLGRPTITPLPAFAVKMVLGKDAANETVLTSQRVIPEKLLAAGYQFEHPNLEGALRDTLQKERD